MKYLLIARYYGLNSHEALGLQNGTCTC